MKKLIKLGSFAVMAMILFISCQSNHDVATPKNEVVSFSFQDDVIYGEFEVLDVEKNKLRGKLKLTNTQNSKVSFPFRDVVFKNESSIGKISLDYSKTIKDYEEKKKLEQKNRSTLSEEELNILKEKEIRMKKSRQKLMDMNSQSIVESNLELGRKEEKGFLIKVEFEKEITDLKDVKVMLNGLYKQLLSKR